jgi:DNA-binding PadR family transcriptional regulator
VSEERPQCGGVQSLDAAAGARHSSSFLGIEYLPLLENNRLVNALLSAKAALLQALFHGPGYGVGLVRLVREKTGGHVRLGHGNVYAALRALNRGGLVRSWTVIPRGRRGARRRLYYELTSRGIAAAEAQRRALAALVVHVALERSIATTALMRKRLDACAELSGSVLELRDRMKKAMA